MKDSNSALNESLKIDTNVAALLRDIAANAEKVTGKILRAADKAAKEGKAKILIKVSEDDYNNIRTHYYGYYEGKCDITPLVDKLESLGFKLDLGKEEYNWLNDKIYYLYLKW